MEDELELANLVIPREMRKWTKDLIEEVLASNSSLVSGPYEASGVKFTWSLGFQESPKIRKIEEILIIPF